MLSRLGLYWNGFFKVLNLRVLAPLSRMAFIIGAWLVSEWLPKSSEFARVGSTVEVGFLLSALGLHENGFLKF